MNIREAWAAPEWRGGGGPDFVVGYATSETRGPVAPGTKPYFCSRCTAEVYLAPSSQQRIRGGARPLCMDCFDKIPAGQRNVYRPSNAEIVGDLSGTN